MRVKYFGGEGDWLTVQVPLTDIEMPYQRKESHEGIQSI